MNLDNYFPGCARCDKSGPHKGAHTPPTKKRKLLNSKTCSCCGIKHSKESWEELKHIGDQLTEDETGKYRLELRNCHCGTTLGIEHAC